MMTVDIRSRVKNQLLSKESKGKNLPSHIEGLTELEQRFPISQIASASFCLPVCE